MKNIKTILLAVIVTAVLILMYWYFKLIVTVLAVATVIRLWPLFDRGITKVKEFYQNIDKEDATKKSEE